MNGPQHYREGERHLSAASFLDKPGGKPVDPTGAMYHLMAAQARFAAAQVAVDADRLADRYVGDGPHINEWRDAVSWLVPAEIVDDAPQPRIPGKPYSPPVETALRNLNLAGHVTPADTLAAVIPVIAGHVAEALVDGEDNAVRLWARSVIDELKRVGLDLAGHVESRVEDLNGGKPFSYDTPAGYSDEPPF
ncbi:hypothetical protein PV728_47855 [Streptomyces europaeiscabiei]|uniref:hypothetical protein n=1 Tax=Streptomyces europaeiscabiei TaxID=146819 RepID=UPI0029B38706|nr:hypothetical protein [Streptomyces europaeiscabiei]MDX3637766.1 hypothetical protein [Streptomyces europaeiscabiei]MDX3655578.1 hypothetical protein [Streptomyces europaeiscabiei]